LGAIVLKDRETGELEELHPAACFVFIGLDPNTEFVKGSVDLDDRGLIMTDMGLQTSMAGVFAAGDVRSGSTKQLASAVGEGAAAAIGIRMFLDAQDARPMHVM
ncbi:MAG TPA: FAD-dependent oxidoreductase, partial [Gemmatimonadota bacterium]|nr:FAD-dependent oxidoreductase [Gemmatimonadota bacterium]